MSALLRAVIAHLAPGYVAVVSTVHDRNGSYISEIVVVPARKAAR